jgi:hypothetical protein
LALRWLASACISAARACRVSACVVSRTNSASTWPLRTTSPTLTFTLDRRRPLTSAPTLASCQAAMSPVACSRTGSASRSGSATVTVSAGRGASVAVVVAGVGASPAGRNSHTASSTRTIRASAASGQNQRRRGWGVAFIGRCSER